MEDAPAQEPSSPLRQGRGWSRFLRVVRRLHLYSGLFMLPWVLLYGVTAFLFNHPDVWSDRQVRPLGVEEASGTGLEGLPSARELASQVKAALEKAERDRGRDMSLSLVNPEKARFAEEQGFVVGRGDGQRHDISFYLSNGTGTIRSRTEGSPGEQLGERPPFFNQGPLKLDDGLSERIKNGVTSVLRRLDLSAEQVAVVFLPELIFEIEAEGRVWQVIYDPLAGTGTVRGAGEPDETFSTRRFLTRLHLAHGFPRQANARWFWAVLVDVMFGTMVFWALSGLLMWWQLKTLRRWGLVILGVSVLTAALLFYGMHAAFAGAL